MKESHDHRSSDWLCGNPNVYSISYPSSRSYVIFAFSTSDKRPNLPVVVGKASQVIYYARDELLELIPMSRWFESRAESSLMPICSSLMNGVWQTLPLGHGNISINNVFVSRNGDVARLGPYGEDPKSESENILDLAYIFMNLSLSRKNPVPALDEGISLLLREPSRDSLGAVMDRFRKLTMDCGTDSTPVRSDSCTDDLPLADLTSLIQAQARRTTAEPVRLGEVDEKNALRRKRLSIERQLDINTPNESDSEDESSKVTAEDPMVWRRPKSAFVKMFNFLYSRFIDSGSL